MRLLNPFAALFSVFAFSGCENKPDSVAANLTDAEALGVAKEAAQESFARLSGELKAAIESENAAAAISVCAERAPAILQEVGAEKGLKITRMSDKPRNPEGAALGDDLGVIEYFRKGLKSEGTTEPQLASHPDGSKTVRLPIVISQPLCLQCHGSEGEVVPETREAIAAIYPKDQATGYALGDLRGIWKIDVPAAK